MAVAEIIGAAIGVLLLVVVAYILVGGTLSAAETVANAQKDITLQNEASMGTLITITEKKIVGGRIIFNVTNAGNEIISDYSHMDIFSYNNSPSLGYQHFRYDSENLGVPGTWTITYYGSDYVHPTQMDPGENIGCEAVFSGINPVWLEVVTSNGVYNSAYI